MLGSRRGAVCGTLRGSVTHFTWAAMVPHWDWGTVNFWPQLAFAFTGLELVSAMSEEIRDPQRTLPRAVLGSGILIAAIYIVGTIAVLSLVPAAQVHHHERRFSGAHARLHGSAHRGCWRARGVARHDRQRRRRWLNRRRNRARSIRRRHRSLSAGGIWENSSQMENAVHFDSRAGDHFRSCTSPDANQCVRR